MCMGTVVGSYYRHVAVLQVSNVIGIAVAALVLKLAPAGKSLLCLHAASASTCIVGSRCGLVSRCWPETAQTAELAAKKQMATFMGALAIYTGSLPTGLVAGFVWRSVAKLRGKA